MGKSKPEMLRGDVPLFTPYGALDYITGHSGDWRLTTEDLPRPDNRVTVDAQGGIVLSDTPDNVEPHRQRDGERSASGWTAAVRRRGILVSESGEIDLPHRAERLREDAGPFPTFARLCVRRRVTTEIIADRRHKHVPLNSTTPLSAKRIQDEEDDVGMWEP